MLAAIGVVLVAPVLALVTAVPSGAAVSATLVDRFGTSGAIEDIAISGGAVYTLGQVANVPTVRKYVDDALEWTSPVGVAVYEWDNAIAVDGSGNVYVGGSLYGHGFVRKLTPSGGDPALTADWTRSLPNTGSSDVRDLEIDGGDLFVGGSTSAPLTGQTQVGSTDAFVIRMTLTNTIVSINQFGSVLNDVVMGLATDGAGNLYAAGSAEDALTGSTSLGNNDAFLRAYTYDTTSWSTPWTYQFGTTSSDSGDDVEVDGDVFVTGTTYGTFGAAAIGERDAFIAAFEPVGSSASSTPNWVRQFGTASMDEVGELSVGAAGVTVAASSWSPYQGIVATYSTTGAHQWTELLGTGGYNYAAGVAQTAGAVYVGGHSEGTVASNSDTSKTAYLVRIAEAATPAAPVITEQPVAQSVTSGQTATFTATATSTVVMTVRWYWSANGTDWTPQTTAATIASGAQSTYTIPTNTSWNGWVRAAFTNATDTTTSDAVTLTVASLAPQVTTHPESQTVTDGGTASFSSAATGDPTPTRLWQESTDGGTSWHDLTGMAASPLTFTATLAMNGYQYRAQFTGYGSPVHSNVATLTVTASTSAPELTGVSASWNGGLITISYSVTGTPTPVVEYQANGHGKWRPAPASGGSVKGNAKTLSLRATNSVGTDLVTDVVIVRPPR